MHQITPKELGLYQQRQSHSLSASPSRPLNITSLSAGIFITLQGSRKLRGITISIACTSCSPFYPSWFHITLPLRSTYHTLSDSNFSTLPHQFSLRVASVHNTSCTYVQYVVLLVVLAQATSYYTTRPFPARQSTCHLFTPFFKYSRVPHSFRHT